MLTRKLIVSIASSVALYCVAELPRADAQVYFNYSYCPPGTVRACNPYIGVCSCYYPSYYRSYYARPYVSIGVYWVPRYYSPWYPSYRIYRYPRTYYGQQFRRGHRGYWKRRR